MSEPQKKKNPNVKDFLSPPASEEKPDYGAARTALIGALSSSREVRFGLVTTTGVTTATAANNAWNNIWNLLYGPSGPLSAYEGYNGDSTNQARKFKSYVKRLCNYIIEKKLTLDNQVQWDLEITAFENEATRNQAKTTAIAERNRQRESDRATWNRVETGFGLNPLPYAVPATANRSDPHADSANQSGPLSAAENLGSVADPIQLLDNDQSLIAAVATKSPKNRLGDGRMQWDRGNSNGCAFAMANALAVQFSENMLEATTRRNANAQIAAPTMTASPSKRVGRIRLLIDADPSPSTKKRLQAALAKETEEILAMYNE